MTPLTRMGLRLLCTALGFTAVAAKQGGPAQEEATKVPRDNQGIDLARLMESSCLTNVPEALGGTGAIPGGDGDAAEADRIIDWYKADLRNKGEAPLAHDRATLVRLYDRLLQRRTRRQEQHFYASAPDELIASRILRLVDDEIAGDGDLL